MSNIHWKIIKKVQGKRCYIKLNVDDEHLQPLSSFFTFPSASSYPDTVEEAIQGRGRDINGTGITFPGDLDGDELAQREPIPYDMMEVYNPFSETQIPQSTFFQILLEVGETLLSVKKEIGDTSKEWEEKMEKALATLRLKVE